MRIIKLFEQWNTNFTEQQIIDCIESGKLIEVDVIQDNPKKPTEPVRPLSIDGDYVLVDFEDKIWRVKIKNITKIGVL